jgi:hypothetical protein
MSISRRALLTTAGSAIVVVGAGLGGLALKADLSVAQRPWNAAGKGFGDARLDALSYAILAPNPHNLQPWRARLVAADRILLFADAERLPATDPFDRQITIGLGAFLELLRLAAAAGGYRADVSAFPEGTAYPRLDQRPVASVRLVKDAAIKADPLFGAVLDRRTARVPFEAQRIPELGPLGRVSRFRTGLTAFDWTREPGRVAELKALARRSWHIEHATDATRLESTRLTRIGAGEINAQPDGISLGGMAMEAAGMAGVLSRANMEDPGSWLYAESLDFYDGLIAASPAFGWLTTPANTRADQLNAGADWLRINLAATRAGIAMHPLSQALQEFPEMAGPYREVHAMLGVRAPAVIQGLFRFGYTKAPPPAPRWPLEARLIGA